MNIVNDKVTEYVNTLYRPLNISLKELRDDAEMKNVPIIVRDTETFILNLMRIKKPLRILEIGTAVGYSAACFAYALPETKIVSLELSEEMYEIASENLEKFGFSDRVRVIQGDAIESLKQLADEIKDVENDGFDMVFIDAAKGHYKEFWDGSVSICKKDAVIVSDNVLLKARTASDDFITERRQKTSVRRMREYLKYITNLDYADTTVLSLGDGVSLSVLKKEGKV